MLIAELENKVLVRIHMEEGSYIVAKVNTAHVVFPMKYMITGHSLGIEILVGFNYIPSSYEFDLKYDSTEFYIEQERVPKTLYSIGFMIRSEFKFEGLMGCCFKDITIVSSKRLRKLSRTKRILERIETTGIDYQEFTNFNINLPKRITREKRVIGEKIEDNIDMLMLPNYNHLRKIEDKARFSYTKKQGEKARMIKQELLAQRQFDIKNAKNRNDRLKEIRFEKTVNRLQELHNMSVWIAWVKLIRMINIICEIKRFIITKMIQRRSGFKMQQISRIVSKFLVPLKRSKISRIIGTQKRVQL